MSRVTAILLAAGGSSRLGRAKQLLDLHGVSLVRRSAGMLLKLTPSVVVVTGSKKREVELELEDLPVRLIHNDRWREGVGTSIACAMGAVPVSTQAALIVLCDQYRLELEGVQKLLEAWEKEPGRIVVARWEKLFGPPAIFPRSLFVELSRLTGDRGARQLMVQNRMRLSYVSLSEAAYDLDDRVDLARMRRYEAENAAD